MKLLVVIVNFRTADLTIGCLGAVREQIESIPTAKLVVVDNASGDESADRIDGAICDKGWQDWAGLMPLAHNGGFAAGNNAALEPALHAADPPEYVLLLNPDTIARPGAVRALLEFMESHPEVGIGGSRLEDPDGTPQISAFRFPSVLGELESGVRVKLISRLLARWIVAPPVQAKDHAADWVAGASMMVRRAVFESVGLLDERYFMYFEEVDFCRRAQQAGWSCWYVPESRVVHLIGQSSGVTDAARARHRRPAYWFEARRLFFLRHYGRFRTLLADLLWAGGFSAWRVRRAILRTPDNDPEHLLADFVGYNLLGAARHPAAR